MIGAWLAVKAFFGAASLTVWLMIAAAVVAWGGGMYVWGRLDGGNLARVAQLEQQVKDYQEAIAMRDRAIAADNARQAHDLAEMELLNDASADLEKYVAKSPTRDNQCLSGADTERLRKLWPSK